MQATFLDSISPIKFSPNPTLVRLWESRPVRITRLTFLVTIAALFEQKASLFRKRDVVSACTQAAPRDYRVKCRWDTDVMIPFISDQGLNPNIIFAKTGALNIVSYFSIGHLSPSS